MTLPLVLVQAVPWEPRRAVRAARLKEATGGEVVWDEKRSAWDTWLKVLRRAGQEPFILLEDDVVLSSGWEQGVVEAVAERPDECISFFCYRDGCPPDGRSGWAGEGLFWGNLCLYMPAGLAAEILHDCTTRPSKSYRMTHDSTVERTLRRLGKRVWVHQPSLVDHEDWVSAVSPGRRKRVANAFQR